MGGTPLDGQAAELMDPESEPISGRPGRENGRSIQTSPSGPMLERDPALRISRSTDGVRLGAGGVGVGDRDPCSASSATGAVVPQSAGRTQCSENNHPERQGKQGHHVGVAAEVVRSLAGCDRVESTEEKEAA